MPDVAVPSGSPSPWEVLGVGPEAGPAELAAARRRRALEEHPDRGGDEEAMQAVNAAYEEALRLYSGVGAAARAPTAPAAPAEPPSRADRTRRSPRRPRWILPAGVQHDGPSFTVAVLPMDAFEALLVVTSWIGEVLVDDPPYTLEVMLHDPCRCWCRLDLMPDAGATMVSLLVAAIDGEPPPDIEAVRDTWVAGLNQPIW